MLVLLFVTDDLSQDPGHVYAQGDQVLDNADQLGIDVIRLHAVKNNVPAVVKQHGQAVGQKDHQHHARFFKAAVPVRRNKRLPENDLRYQEK